MIFFTQIRNGALPAKVEFKKNSHLFVSFINLHALMKV